MPDEAPKYAGKKLLDLPIFTGGIGLFQWWKCFIPVVEMVYSSGGSGHPGGGNGG